MTKRDKKAFKGLPAVEAYGEAVLASGAPALPKSRAELLAEIESGVIEHLDFPAQVFRRGRNRNFLTFRDEDLSALAASYVGQPFLRNHATWDIGARDGTILESSLDGEHIVQVVRLTTRQGMTDYVEGRIDRFSIGWFYDDIFCSVCGSRWVECVHYPGREYQTEHGKVLCELVFSNPKGKETSAVNTPAVDDTGLLSTLVNAKLEIVGEALPAVTGAQSASQHFSKGETMKKKVRRDGAVLEVGEDEVLPTDEVMPEGSAPTLAASPAPGNNGEGQLIALCSNLLESSLATSRLPAVTQARLRKQFNGRAFQAPELEAAIQEAREEVSALTAGQTVVGPARVTNMFSDADQFRLALEDLLEVERDPKEAGIKVHRLSGIREAYLSGTGDKFFHGGFYEEFALGAAVSFTVVTKNAMNKRLVQAWEKLRKVYGWWEKITSIEHFENLEQVDWIITGTIGTLPSITKGNAYTELPLGDVGETTDWSKYGGYIGLYLEDIINDNVGAFRRLPTEAAMGGIRNISEKIASIFTVNSGAGPTMSDGGALFNAVVTTTLGGHKNLLTTALGTDLVAWRAVETAMFKQPMLVKQAAGSYGTGKAQGIRPKYCLVSQDQAGQAEDLFLKEWNAGGTNMAYQKAEPLVVPEWTDATDWAAAADKDLLPGAMLGEIFGIMPEIFVAGGERDAAMFTNDESRIKIRQFLTYGVANWRALHKNNVTG
jgi:hypothetical protein